MTTKILVIGLRKQHIQVLQKHFQGRYEIHSLDDQAIHAKRLSNIESFSSIISCTKFTNHTTERLYNKHKGFTRISGGRSSVKNFLEVDKSFAYRC